MDLRSIINNEAGESSITKQAAAPVTPVQAPLQQGFREYNQPPQASPGKHPSQDYGAQAGGPYASPTAYQGNYQGRPPPPPIQAPPQNDLRSPARSYSAQSPYQHTPVSSAGQYPFPQTHQTQTPQSPAQRNQYPPTLQQRESYTQNPAPHLRHQNSYSKGSPPPQTPPIGIPGAPHPYLQHQRSQSSVSTSTPTSAHSQQQYFNSQYPQDSPVSASHFPPSQIPQHQRQQSQQSQHSQQSQPGTPLGPPLTQRQASGTFAQPSSPYQQRGTSSGSFSHFQQTSPAPPAPASISRLPSTPGGHDSQRPSLADQQRRSQSERERSLSVSPKTRLPSQPRGEVTTPQSENGYNNSSKRKMGDRDSLPEEPHLDSQLTESEPKPQVNGDHRIPSSSPQQPPKKRIRYTEPPIWAQSVRNKGLASLGNRAPSKVNGKQPAAAFQSQIGHSPLMKAETNGTRQLSPAATRATTQADVPSNNTSIFLGPWEESITGKKPFEEMTKLVADFLYLNVVSRGDLGELASRGVEVEIEAKLGQLVDRETNERFYLPVKSECIIADNTRLGFRSSMTEAQHRSLNDFLNAKVTETHPANPGQTKGRVKIDYLHRREVDKFYELPPAMKTALPAAVRENLNPRHTVKVRITHDQKTGQILAKIIKVRIVDLNIYNPQYPLDCRISINFEMRFDGDIEEIIASGFGDRVPDRSKDRLSYTQGHYQIDLTQVTHVSFVNGANRTEKEHELEIEVSTSAIRDQGQKAAAGEPNDYLPLVGGLVDNVRVLSRAVPPQ